MFYDSKAELIQFTEWQMTEKVSWTIYRPDKENEKSIGELELSMNDNVKALKYKSCHSFHAFQKKIVEFTDSTNSIYWPRNIAKKAANCSKKIFQYMSVLNTF